MVFERHRIDKTKTGSWREEMVCEWRKFSVMKKDFLTKILHEGFNIGGEN